MKCCCFKLFQPSQSANYKEQCYSLIGNSESAKEVVDFLLVERTINNKTYQKLRRVNIAFSKGEAKDRETLTQVYRYILSENISPDQVRKLQTEFDRLCQTVDLDKPSSGYKLLDNT